MQRGVAEYRLRRPLWPRERERGGKRERERERKREYYYSATCSVEIGVPVPVPWHRATHGRCFKWPCHRAKSGCSTPLPLTTARFLDHALVIHSTQTSKFTMCIRMGSRHTVTRHKWPLGGRVLPRLLLHTAVERMWHIEGTTG